MILAVFDVPCPRCQEPLFADPEILEAAQRSRTPFTPVFRCRHGHSLRMEQPATGRHRTRWPRFTACLVCHALFLHVDPRQRCCSKACAIRRAQQYNPKRRRLPSNAEVRRLYVDQGWSSTQIARAYRVASHRSVCKLLERLGIARRRVGCPATVHCIELGCTARAWKLRTRIRGKESTAAGASHTTSSITACSRARTADDSGRPHRNDTACPGAKT